MELFIRKKYNVIAISLTISLNNINIISKFI